MSQYGERVNKLIKEIQKGNKKSFEQLYEITYNHLTIIAYNYLYDTSELEDVINESYFRVFKYIDSVDVNKDGYNWICKIVQNVAYRYNEKHGVIVDVNKAETQGLFYEIDDKIIDNSLIMQAIKTLDNDEQQLIYLKYWEDLSYFKIAQLKGMKKATVYKKISIAMKKIEKFLRKQ